MKQFFFKKKVYMVFFLVFLFGMFFWNAFCNWEILQTYGNKLGSVKGYTGLQEWMEEGETLFTSHFPGKQALTEIYSFIHKAIGKREIHNFQYIVDKDGMIYYGSLFQRDGEDLEEYADRLKALAEFSAMHGADFMFLMAPFKVIGGLSQVDRNLMLNDPNPRMDKLLLQLQQRQVHALDLRLAMLHSKEKLSDLFYATDHYWTGRGAFYGTKALIEDLEAYYGMELDPTGYYKNLDNYDRKIYENVMLGSAGKNIGVTYCGLEDFEQLLPKNNGEMTFRWESDMGLRSGNLKDTLYLEEKLASKDPYSGSVYGVYLNQLNQRDTISKPDCPNGLKIGVLRDAYFSPMAIYLAPMVSSLDLYDSSSKEATEAFLKAIENNQFDYVIYEAYPYHLEQKNFQFFEEP